MLDGLVITAVGMLTVFVFLGILVISMVLLRAAIARFLPEPDRGVPAALVAAVAAAVHASRRRSSGERQKGC